MSKTKPLGPYTYEYSKVLSGVRVYGNGVYFRAETRELLLERMKEVVKLLENEDIKR